MREAIIPAQQFIDGLNIEDIEWRVAPVQVGSMSVREGTAAELNPLLAREHYLGPLKSGRLILVGVVDGEVVAGQVWRRPTSRRLPSDGSWLELSRWCLTPAAGENAGSRFHSAAVRYLRANEPEVTTLVSYSDPSAGHTGALYRACNWDWAPVWHRLRPPPSGQGTWGGGPVQAVKDRWIFSLKRDPRRGEIVAVRDAAAIRFWAARATPQEIKLALRSPAPDLAAAASLLAAVTS